VIGSLVAFGVGVAIAAALERWRTRCHHEPRAVRLQLPCVAERHSWCHCRYGVQRREHIATAGATVRWMCVACGLDAPVVSLPTPGPGVSRATRPEPTMPTSAGERHPR
jgi:hypothetical protein